VVGQVWGAKGADRFLLDQIRARMDLPATKDAVRSLSERWPRATAKLVEDKANGPAVIQELRHELAGLIEVTPEGGKIARAHAVSPMAESGNVYLPHPSIAPWVEGFMEEAASFPTGRHDDQVDAMTQALNRLRQGGGKFHIPESQIVIDPFMIPEGWPRAFGMAMGPSGLGAVWGARDASGAIYVYAEHQCPHAEPSENARAIKRCGDWIPGILSSASISGSQDARNRIAEIYRERGLTIYAVQHQAQEAAMYDLLQLLATKRLKVFASLAGLVSAYRVGNEEAVLLRACEALITGGSYMRTEPRPLVHEYRQPSGPLNRNSWMA